DPAWRYRAVGGELPWKRAHAVGGRANIWGGWSNRFTDAVFRDADWPFAASALAPYYARAERWLSVVPSPLLLRYREMARRLDVRVEPVRTAVDSHGVWTGRDVVAAAQAEVRSFVTRIEVCGRRAVALEVLRPSGARVIARARALVLAASPIETTRILLAS